MLSTKITMAFPHEACVDALVKLVRAGGDERGHESRQKVDPEALGLEVGDLEQLLEVARDLELDGP